MALRRLPAYLALSAFGLLAAVVLIPILALKAVAFAATFLGITLDTGLNCDYYSAGGATGAGGAGAGSGGDGQRQRLPRDEENRRVNETADSMRDTRDPTDPRAHNEYQDVRNFVNRCFGDPPIGSEHYPQAPSTPKDTSWSNTLKEVWNDPLGKAADAARGK